MARLEFLLLASALVMGSSTLEVERIDDTHLRIRGRGFSQGKLELEVTPGSGAGSSSPCAPYALKQLVGVRRGAFDVTLEADEGCRLTCGARRDTWTVTARVPETEGEPVARTDPFGCESWPLSEAEVGIRKAWKQWHPGKLLPPACDHEDPVRLLQADVDESPGVETVLASRRFGLFVLGARQPAPPLAWTELSCEQGARVSEEDVPRLLELSTLRASGLSPVDLVLRTLHVEHCGAIGQLELLDRQGRTLTPLVRVDVFKYWQCWDLPLEESRASVESPSPGLLSVRVEGSTRKQVEGGELGPPEPFQSTSRYRLVGRRFVPVPADEGR